MIAPGLFRSRIFASMSLMSYKKGHFMFLKPQIESLSIWYLIMISHSIGGLSGRFRRRLHGQSGIDHLLVVLTLSLLKLHSEPVLIPSGFRIIEMLLLLLLSLLYFLLQMSDWRVDLFSRPRGAIRAHHGMGPSKALGAAGQMARILQGLDAFCHRSGLRRPLCICIIGGRG